MPDTNYRLGKLEEARQTIEETLVVMAHLEKRQSEMLKEQAVAIAAHQADMKEIREGLKEQKSRGKETDARIEKLVSTIGSLIAKPK